MVTWWIIDLIRSLDKIALIRDDVTKISLNVEPRLGGDHFAWFVDV